MLESSAVRDTAMMKAITDDIPYKSSELLMTQDKGGRTVLHKVTKHGDAGMVQDILFAMVSKSAELLVTRESILLLD